MRIPNQCDLSTYYIISLRFRSNCRFLFGYNVAFNAVVLQIDSVQGIGQGLQRLFTPVRFQLALPYSHAVPPHGRQTCAFPAPAIPSIPTNGIRD